MSDSSKPKEEIDYFRDTSLRYVGYANEIGESFRSMISHQAVMATYGLAFGYVFMDVIDKANKTYKKESQKREAASSPVVTTLKSATDCFLWQTFASVLVPGFTINRICKFSSILLNKSNVKALMSGNKVITTAIGLCSIPLIIHPIDHGCHVVMDKTIRPILGIDPHLKD